MPPTFSVSTSIAVAPAAPAATAAGVPVLGAPGQTPPDAGAADFLRQFKAAVKNLTKAVVLPHVTSPLTPDAAPGAEAAPAVAADAKPVDHKSEPVPDVLAALGFVLVPIAFQAPLAPPLLKNADESAAAASVVPGALAAAPGLPLPKSMADESPAAKPPTPEAQSPLAEGLLPIPGGQALPTASAAALAKTLADATKADGTKADGTKADASPVATATPPKSPTPSLATTSAPAPTAPSANDPATLAPGNLAQTPPAARHASAPSVASDATLQAIGSQQTAQQQMAQQGGFQHGGAKDDGQSTSEKAAAVTDSASVQGQGQTNDAALAAAAGSTISNNLTAAPAHVRPAEVVAQIAHQADLYRLPGNRGVRIQLHPEGLGGVEVTMRYGVGGALQLHINVEHAATGALVQAGWTQLRDALVTQGISPDRLVMSVTAPPSSNQLDFAGGGSGRQTDPGLAGFAQSQSGQQRQDQPDQPGQRGWNGAVEPTSPSDDSPRVASTTAVTSRIDYRA